MRLKIFLLVFYIHMKNGSVAKVSFYDKMLVIYCFLGKPGSIFQKVSQQIL